MSSDFISTRAEGILANLAVVFAATLLGHAEMGVARHGGYPLLDLISIRQARILANLAARVAAALVEHAEMGMARQSVHPLQEFMMVFPQELDACCCCPLDRVIVCEVARLIEWFTTSS